LGNIDGSTLAKRGKTVLDSTISDSLNNSDPSESELNSINDSDYDPSEPELNSTNDIDSDPSESEMDNIDDNHYDPNVLELNNIEYKKDYSIKIDYFSDDGLKCINIKKI